MPPLGLPLALLALPLAVAAAVLEQMDSVYGVLLLPASAALLAIAAAAPAKPDPRVRPEAARLRLVVLTFLLVAMLLVLAFVQALAAFAATGLLFSLSQLASLFVRGYPLLLASFVVAGALVRVAAGRWGAVLEVGRARRWGAALLAVLSALPAALVAFAATPAGADVLVITVERAPFVSAMAVMAAVGALWLGGLPAFPQMGDWLARTGLRQAKLGRQLTLGLALGSILPAAAGVALWVLAGPGAGVPLLGLALFFAVTASYPAGVTRFVPSVGLEDPDVALRKQRQVLLGMLAAAAVGLLLAAAAAALLAAVLLDNYEDDFIGLVATLGMGVAAFAAALQAALAVVSTRFPVPGALTPLRRAVAWNMSLASLLLTAFAVLLGSGLAQGPGVGAATGALLLLGAGLANGGHNLLRVVMPPPKPKAPEKKEGETYEADAGPSTKEEITRTMHLAYAAGLGFTALMVALVGATSLGVVDVEESTGVEPSVFIVLAALLGLPVVALALWRYFRVRRVEVEIRQQAQSLYKKRLTPEEVSRLVIIGSSISASVIFTVFALLTQFGVLQSLGPFDLTPKYSTDFFVFAILVGLGPYGFMRAREQSRMRAIDAKFPEFLRDLAESKRAGMTLTQAVVTASKGNYGALTGDIRKMAAQIEWGISFSEALERFSRRVHTPLIERSVSLIIQASNAGGNVVDILHAAAEDAREIQLLLRERKTSMSIYVMIIYIAFFVFLSVIAILDAQFLPEVAKAIGGAQGVQVGPIKFGHVDVPAFEQVFFHAAIVQAMGGGFVAGVMEEGRPVAGLRHVFIMVILGYISFRFLIGG